MRAKSLGFELDVGPLWPRQFLQRCRSNDHGAVAVPAGPMQERGGGLDEAPDCFQRFVREPILAPIKQIAGVFQVPPAIVRIHVRRALCVVRRTA
jgi:hypothetical protein